ncbi:MAG: Xaa-Pro peptidase family protein [Eubacterium sp.]|nr:Xaa-Pro peptidase family protein [Eubacterium sp.]
MKDRIAREVLAPKDLDAIVVTDQYNFHYLSGFDGEGELLISAGRAVLITDSRYTIAAREFSAPAGFEVIEYNSGHPRKEILNGLLSEDGLHKIGFEDLSLTVAELEKYRKMLPDIEIALLGEALDALRMVKSPDEIALMEEAEHIGDRALEAVLPLIKPGITELELACEIEYAMKREGAMGFSFETIVASGLNSARPHHRPTDKPIEKGDFVTMDFGCIYKGYCSDMTRTVVVGKASERQKEVYHTVLNAQLAGVEALRPGLKGKDVDAVSRDIIKAAGYGEYFGHGLGHSAGLFIHESPRLSPSEERVLVPGNIETVEPGIYIDGFGGVRIEDMCVVTEDGCRSLALSPKDLIEL